MTGMRMLLLLMLSVVNVFATGNNHMPTGMPNHESIASQQWQNANSMATHTIGHPQTPQDAQYPPHHYSHPKPYPLATAPAPYQRNQFPEDRPFGGFQRSSFLQPSSLQQEGFFSKLKSSLYAAGNVLASSLDFQAHDRTYPSGSDVPVRRDHGHSSFLGNSVHYDRASYSAPQMRSSYKNDGTEAGSGIVNKMRTFLAGDEQPASRYAPNEQSSEHDSEHVPHQYRYTPYSQVFPQQLPQMPSTAQMPTSTSVPHNMWRAEVPNHPAVFSEIERTNPSQPQTQFLGAQTAHSKPVHVSDNLHDTLRPPVPAEVDWLNNVPNEPQIMVHNDNIVFIMKPRAFYRKKLEISRAGPQALQVFADFERALTKFRCADGSRALLTVELLEAAGVISPDALRMIQRLNDEFDQEGTLRSEGGSIADSAAARIDSYSAFEELQRRCQETVAVSGNLQVGQVGPVSQAMLAQLALRDGLKDGLQVLQQTGVPLYIFSAGYGDVVCAALAVSGVFSSTGPPTIPPNVRIISNFFKAGPDGIVRAFSSPIVHDRNKNVTTAAKVMGMPMPQRPHAFVLASHEDDVAAMTDGLANLKEVLSVGYLELTEDIAQRLPTFLESFDAVVLGDGSMKFVNSLLEDLVRIPQPSKLSGGNGLRDRLPTLGFGLRRGLGLFSSSDNQQRPDTYGQNQMYNHRTGGFGVPQQ